MTDFFTTVATRDIKTDDFSNQSSLIEKIKFLLQYAVLAPSTHNIQPWLFKVEDNYCQLYLNKKFHLPFNDPTTRDAYISMGCVLENLVVAAEHYGVLDRVEQTVDQNSGLVATVYFKDTEKNKIESGKMIEAILKRLNVRGTFDNKDISFDIVNNLTSLSKSENISLNLVRDQKKIESLARLTSQGMRLAHADNDFRKELSGWVRHNYSKRPEGIPGYAMKAPGLLSFLLPKMIRYANLSPILAKLNFKSVSSAPLVCVISSKENTPSVWVEVGRLAERFFLTAETFDLSSSVFVAAVEMGELYKELQEITENEHRPQFLFCTGYMSKKHRFPKRHAVGSKLL